MRSSDPAGKNLFPWTPTSEAEKAVHISLRIYKELIVPPEIDERYGLPPVPPKNLYTGILKKNSPLLPRQKTSLKALCSGLK